MAKNKTCNDCQHRVASLLPDKQLIAVCRLYPPSVHLLMQQNGLATMSVYPQVTDKDWCGQHVLTAPADVIAIGGK